MTTIQILNASGLTFDIIGVLILFKFGLPSDVSKKGIVYRISEQSDIRESEKWKKYVFYSRLGLCFVMLGFCLQFISQFITR